MKSSQHLGRLEIDVGYLHYDVVKHPLFKQLVNTPTLRCFMEHHVFVVWSFTCLMEVFYKKMASLQLPRLPPQYAKSVFEVYRMAMSRCGANKSPMDAFLTQLQKGKPLDAALRAPGVPTAARVFIENTFAFFDKPIHQLAAACVFSREGITGDLFSCLLKKNDTAQLTLPSEFQYYLQRYVDLDADSRYPKALRILEHLCGEDTTKWQEATRAATQVLQAQQDFWTAIASILT